MSFYQHTPPWKVPPQTFSRNHSYSIPKAVKDTPSLYQYPQQLPVYFHPCSRSCSISVCASEIRLTWPQNFLHLDLLHLFWLFGTLPSWPNKSACSNRPTMHCPCFYKISVEFLGKSPQFKDQPAADSCPTEWLPWWWDSHLLHRSPASAGSGFLKVAIRLVVPA